MKKKALIIVRYILGAAVLSFIAMFCIVNSTSLSKRDILIDIECQIFEEQSSVINKVFSKSISDFFDLSIDSGFVDIVKKPKLTQEDMDLLATFLSKATDENSEYKVDLCLFQHDLAFFDNQVSNIREYQNINNNVLDNIILLNVTNAYWKREHNLKYNDRTYNVISYVQPILLGYNRAVGAFIINYDLDKLKRLLLNRDGGSVVAFVSNDFKNTYSMLGSSMESARFAEYINTERPVNKVDYSYTFKNSNMFLYSTGYVTDIKLVKLIQKDYFNSKLNKLPISYYLIIYSVCFLVTLIFFAYIYISFTRVTKFKGGPLLLSNIIKRYESNLRFYSDNSDNLIRLIYNSYLYNTDTGSNVINHFIEQLEHTGRKMSNICGLSACILSYKDSEKLSQIKSGFFRELKKHQIQILSEIPGKICVIFEISSPLMDQIEIDRIIKNQLSSIYARFEIQNDFITFIGKSVNTIEDIKISVESAEELYEYLYYAKRGSFITDNQDLKPKNISGLIEFPSFSKLVYAIDKNSSSLCKDYVEKLFEYIESTNMFNSRFINSMFINLYEVLIRSFSKQLDLACLSDIEDCIENLKKFAYTRSEMFEITSCVVDKTLISVHSSESGASFAKVLDYINANYKKDLSLNELSEMFGVTPQYFSKVFKDNMGTTLVQYLTDLRLNKAIELLENSDMLVKDIATEVGYSNSQYFIRVFKKKFRCSPLKFKRQRIGK